MRELSVDQQEILQAIIDYINENGYSPSIRELCKITGRNSPATVHYHLKRLKRNGFINYNEKENRTIRVLRKEKEYGI